MKQIVFHAHSSTVGWAPVNLNSQPVACSWPIPLRDRFGYNRRDMRRTAVTLIQLSFVLAGIVALFFVLRFNQNNVLYRQMLMSEATFDAALSAEKTRQIFLEATATYVNSDTYVEHYYRNDAGMVLPGERRIVPRVVERTPVATPQPTPTLDVATQAQPWQMWWALLSDAPPPLRQ